MSYVDEVLELVQKKNASEPEFLQAVEEVLNSLRPVIEANEEAYRRDAVLERITEPERQIINKITIYENDNMPWSYLSSAGKVNLTLQNK